MAIAYKGGGAVTNDANAYIISASYTPAVTGGSLLVAAISYASDGTDAVEQVIDDRGNTWTVLTPRLDATNGQALVIAYAMNASAGATTVEAHFGPGAPSFRRLALAEYSGVALTSAFDVQAGQGAANGTAANNVTSGSATTTAAGELVIGAFMDSANGTNTQTAGTGFTKRSTAGLLFIEDLVQTSAGAVAATATFGTAGRYVGAMATFKAGSGNVSPTANAGADQTNVTPGSTVTLDSSASSDPEGSIASRVWSKVSGPTAIGSLSSTTAVSPTYTAPAAGLTDVWRVTVTDSVGATGFDDVSISTAAAVSTPITYRSGGATTEDVNAYSIAGTFSPPVTPGSLLVAVISYAVGIDMDPATAVSSVTDSRGGTWNILTPRIDAVNAQRLVIAYCMNAPGGTTTVTANFEPDPPPYRRIVLAEYSAIATASAFDVEAGQSGANNTATNNVTSGAVTTTVAGDLIVGGIMDTASATAVLSAGTGFTRRSGAGQAFIEDMVQGAAGSVAATATFDTSGRYVAALAAFKVRTGNVPPVANAGADQTNVTPGSTVTLNSSVSVDPDGSLSSRVWSKVSGPTNVSALSSATATSPTYTAPAAGSTDVWRVTVTDNSGATNFDDVVVSTTALASSSTGGFFSVLAKIGMGIAAGAPVGSVIPPGGGGGGGGGTGTGPYGNGAMDQFPTQPMRFVYADATPITTADWDQPGALVVAGQFNTGNQKFKDISAAGGTVLTYIDFIVMTSATGNSSGPYQDMLINASSKGAAVGAWPGNILVSQYGYLTDFRTTSPMNQPSTSNPAWTKAEAVLEQMVADHPHIAGFFLDDLGSRAWFDGYNGSGFVWDRLSSTEKAQYRAGAVALCQAARRVCDRHGLIMAVNGTWEQGSVTVSGGGYPDINQMGNSLAEIGVWEGHSYNGTGSFDELYMHGPQWGADTPGHTQFNIIIALDNDLSAAGDLGKWVNDGRYPYVVGGDGDYAGGGPWASNRWHTTGLPNVSR